FQENGIVIRGYESLSQEDIDRVNSYFLRTVFPMLTPMVFDNYHTFPTLANNRLLVGVVTRNPAESHDQHKASFVQVPHNLPRFYEIESDDLVQFVPIEEIISHNISHLFRNVEILSTNLFRVNRNGDFTLEESEDIESNFLEELKRKLKSRRTGRVVRLDIQGEPNAWLTRLLRIQWDIDDFNLFPVPEQSLVDFTGLLQTVNHSNSGGFASRCRIPLSRSTFPNT